jgi:hypothetical protein
MIFRLNFIKSSKINMKNLITKAIYGIAIYSTILLGGCSEPFGEDIKGVNLEEEKLLAENPIELN